MNRSNKLMLDLFMGAVVPILILKYLSSTLTPTWANVIAALVPVVYVLTDTLFISKTFNFIATTVAITAVVNGVLAFWFVDGFLFAIKDTAPHSVMFFVFSGSLIAGKPLMKNLLAQAFGPDSPQRQQALETLFSKMDVLKNLKMATFLVALQHVVTSTINFWLSLRIVTAQFGTQEFNDQVAHLNAVTRVSFPIAGMVCFGIGLALVFKTLYKHLPKEDGKEKQESDFWTLVDLWSSGQKS